jgi:hypothetical protein
MVTAGVYLIVRSEPIFARSPAASTTVAVIGVVTSIYAGLSAIGQDDIKRVLAYSTISQIGLMLLAAGVGATSAAIFLLVTHAFYKALLFLSAGSVIHGLHDEQDMMKMGGLRRVMPFTTVVWVIGALALAGGPPLAGFFSKDEALAAASLAGRPGLWAAGLAPRSDRRLRLAGRSWRSSGRRDTRAAARAAARDAGPMGSWRSHPLRRNLGCRRLGHAAAVPGRRRRGTSGPPESS